MSVGGGKGEGGGFIVHTFFDGGFRARIAHFCVFGIGVGGFSNLFLMLLC